MKSKVNSFPPACSDHSNHVRHEGNHGISTAFFRPDFKGARSRACVRACVDDGESGREAHSSSHCADVSRKKLPCLPIAQPDGPVFGQQNRKRKGIRIAAPSIHGKMTPWPCGSRPRKPRLESRRDFSAPRERETGFDEFDRQVFDSQVLE